MPELPEIRAHAERLNDAFSGRVLSAFVPLSFTAMKSVAPKPDTLAGATLLRVRHRGKYLLLEIEPVTFVVHLMQGGRLKPDLKQSRRPQGGLARWVFEPADGALADALLLTEASKEKRAGVWIVTGDASTQEPLGDIGPDADGVPVAELGALLDRTSMRLHGFLRDQHQLAGLGRRLANEICHRAALSPFANTSKLSPEEVARLQAAIQTCIGESLAYERSRADMSSSRERPGAVHHRAGETCPECGDTVRAVEYSNYTVNYCPTCQTGGRVLADNTTSKFVK